MHVLIVPTIAVFRLLDQRVVLGALAQDLDDGLEYKKRFRLSSNVVGYEKQGELKGYTRKVCVFDRRMNPSVCVREMS